MKVLIVNTYDNGGAANACLRLHEGLLHKSIASHVLLKDKQKNILHTHKIRPFTKRVSKFGFIKYKIGSFLRKSKVFDTNKIPSAEQVFLNNRSLQLEKFSFPSSNFDITETDLYREADIINLHWVADFLDYKTFFKKNTKPVVWTLHDMNPFTGGEHYEELFLGIDEEGEPIQRIIEQREQLISSGNLNFKKKLISECNNIAVVAPSKWLVEKAKNSEVFKNRPVHHIPYGLNEDIFTPKDKDKSRAVLQLPKDKKVILFVADYVTNERKGFIYLKRVVEQLRLDNVVICAVGDKNEEFKSLNNIIELGVINDEKLMSTVYSVVDVFVIPSLMDNLPNTVLESLMCGTPVIGFPVGGIPEMIQDGINGFLTEDISVASLLKTLTKFLAEDQIFDRAQIRANAVKKYAQEKQAEKYVVLFNNLLK